MSAGSNPVHHRSHSQTREPRTGTVSKVQIQLTMEATDFLESQGQVLLAGSKSGSPQKPLTSWRAKDRHLEQGPIQFTMEATHQLENQGQVLSARSKLSSQWKPFTNWRAKDRHREQGPNPAHQVSHSLPGELRMAVVSRVQIQLTMEATHFLES